MTTVTSLRELISSRFKLTWESMILGPGETIPKIFWENVEEIQGPQPKEYWARLSLAGNIGGQASLGVNGSRLFRREGLVFVQIFSPLGIGLTRSGKLVQTALDAFDGYAVGELWLRNGRVKDIGPDGDWYQVNVLFDYQYTEIK